MMLFFSFIISQITCLFLYLRGILNFFMLTISLYPMPVFYWMVVGLLGFF